MNIDIEAEERRSSEPSPPRPSIFDVSSSYIRSLSNRLPGTTFTLPVTFSLQSLPALSDQAFQWWYHASTLGFIGVYQLRYQYNADGAQSTDLEQWIQVSGMMMDNCQTTRPIATVLLSANITLLQVSNIADNPLTRMTTIMAIISSVVAGLSSFLYARREARLLRLENFLMMKWIDASEHPNYTRSIDFWGCLALPLYSLLWSIGFFVATLRTLIWASPCPIEICTSTSWIYISALTITLFFLIAAGYTFRLCMVLDYIG